MNHYQKFLGLSGNDSRPNFFQLLGISEQETDPDVIKAAAVAQVQKLRQFNEGDNAEACKKLSAEIKRAYQVLANDGQRQKYIDQLHETRQLARARVTPAATTNPTASKSASVAAANATPTDPEDRILTLVAVFAGLMLVLVVGIGTAAYVVFSKNETTVIAAENTESADTASAEIDAMESSVSPAATLAPSPTQNDSTVNIPVEVSSADQQPESEQVTTDTTVPLSPDEPASPMQSVAGALPADSVPIETATTLDEAPSVPVNDDPTFAKQTHSILQKYCYRCHGENETDEGGFNFVLAREKLISSGFVIPNNTTDSPLAARLTSHDSPMPPEGESPRPNQQEIETIRSWVRLGAKPFNDLLPQRMITMDQQFQLIARDLNRVAEKDRIYTRYFSVTHLSNSGYSQEEIRIYKIALAKLLNSLSWNRKLAGLHSINDLQTVYRIDLRDLKWTSDSWATILGSYPYGLLHQSDDAAEVRDQTKTQLPVIRADWFIFTASRPPLYHSLAQIPETDRELEQLLQVNVERNLDETRVIRIGFTRSGVSQHNRLLERHDSIFGAYWKSYDFAGSTGRKNLFDFPVGPGDTATDFDHDGGEIIFHLPNGMLGYMLTDGQGRRIDKGPTNIVSDPRQRDRAVVNGVSCMSCHYGGFIQKSDEVRKHVNANRAAYPNSDAILQLYPESNKASQAIESDTKIYLAALSNTAVGIKQPTRSGEPIVLASLRYGNEIDLLLAASELGITPQDLQDRLSKIADATLNRRIGSLRSKGGVVKRETFVDSFVQLANALHLGPIATIRADQNLAANRRGVPQQAPPANVKRIDILSLRFGNNLRAAEGMLATAQREMRASKWQEAAAHFEDAIRIAPSPAFRLRACESAIKLYEQRGTVEPLLDAYKYILASCRTSREIQQVRDQLFASLRMIVNQGKRWVPSSGSTEIAQWPISTTRAFAATFEPTMTKTPNHEPTLRVLETFYATIQPDPKKQLVVLQRLAAILQARGQTLAPASGLVLAKLLIESGQPVAGATLINRYAKAAFGNDAAVLFQQEADAWAKAGNKVKAMTGLRLSLKLWRSNGRRGIANAYVKMADTYMELGERKKAAELYGAALAGQANSYRVEELQEKLASALDESVKHGNTKKNAESMEQLLDPRRKFRIDAQQAEAMATGHPTSMVASLMRAAENWTKAGDNERAVKAIKRAATANRRTGTSAKYNYPKLAKLFSDTGQSQLAIEQWVLALKKSTTLHSISEYQTQIDAILQETPTLEIDDSVRQLLDANYGYRAQAQSIEKTSSSNSQGRAQNLIRAVESWIKAEDKPNAQRCLVAAESAVGLIPVKPGFASQEGLHRQIADAYGKLALPKDEVRNLLAAMKFCYSDSSAERYFERVNSICQTNSLPQPTLDPLVKIKLDPLNRHRVQATGHEKSAKEHPESAETYYSSAVSSWIRAEETENAIRVANLWATLVMANKTDSQFGYKCGRLGDIFAKLDRKDAALKCYEEQLKSTKAEYSQKRIQKKINQLNIGE